MRFLSKLLLSMGASVVATLISDFVVKESKASKGSFSSEPDYLLILGCTVHGDTPCETLSARIRDAAEFLNCHPSVTAIACGGIVQPDQTKAEAEVISERLEDLGVEKNRIIIENKSKTTVENFKNARTIIESLPDGKDAKLAFLSSEFHLLRAGIIAKKAGVNAETIPSKTPRHELLKAYAREFVCMPLALFDF